MSVHDISGITFDNLQEYVQFTDTTAEDKALETLTQLIMAAVPGYSTQEVGDKIDEIKQANPNWTMDQVFEAAVNELNVAYDQTVIQKIYSAWESFTGALGLTSDDVSEILEDPVSFSGKNSKISSVSVRQAIEMLMLLMIEIAGQESANQLAEGFTDRELILSLAEEKADELIKKGWEAGLGQILSGVCDIGGGIVGTYGVAKQYGAGTKNNTNTKPEAKPTTPEPETKPTTPEPETKTPTPEPETNTNPDQSQSKNPTADAWTTFSQSVMTFSRGMSSGINGVSGIATGFTEAEIAKIEADSQVAGIARETANSLREKALQLAQACQQLLQAMSQADHSALTAIGRA